ncbi:MAG TPA: FAD-dependent oxidoreductase [Jatrophihabitantaceae bacterium]
MGVIGADVVVVGGGLAGTAAAVLLARAGASVTLLERGPPADPVDVGVVLEPDGLAVLAGLGLSSVRRRGCPLDDRLGVRRSVLHEALLGAVMAQPGIACRPAAEVTGCRPDGVVESVWHGRPSTIRADLVLGADGIASVVRRSGDFAPRVRRRRAGYVRGLVSGRGLAPAEYWTALGLFGSVAVDPQTVSFYAAAHARPVRDARDRGALARRWDAVLPPAGEALRRAEDLVRDDAVRIDCRRWHDRRLVLVGDAAHATTPASGPDVSSALVDAAVLAAELAHTRATADGLRRYALRRAPAVQARQDRADRVVHMSRLRRPLARIGPDVGGPSSMSRPSGKQEDPAQLLELVGSLGH